MLPRQILKVHLPRQKRHLQQLLLRQKPNQLASEVEDTDNYDVVDLDLHRSYGRLKLITVNLWDDDSELPEHIQKKLENARIKALEVYRSKYAV
jgi:hypothetical protein